MKKRYKALWCGKELLKKSSENARLNFLDGDIA